MLVVSSLLFFGPAVLVLAGLFFVAARSRRHKQRDGDLRLIGAHAAVATPLVPEGSVLIDGELWPARSRTGQHIPGGTVVITAASGYLLQVDPLD